ncbi:MULTISPECIES: response regulator [Nocardia]|uniref:Response regulator transcription factor n=1 Tax=Nocardia iowensis TaxID=204891 RepID=A0ABX8RT90_NOCIO|nr:response regulator transcription factor [Nocardia iowensis]QXN90706.1 response regulator transcription factor [Nocardia iowensis]
MTSERSERYRVVIADDHTLFRQGVCQILAAEPDFHIVGDGASGHDAVALAAEHRPDVLLLDVEMPGEGAVTTIRQIRGVSPDTRVVVLSMHASTDLVQELTSVGASAYIAKTSGREELCAGIRSVVGDGQMVMWYVPRWAMPSAGEAEGPTLSSRELEILKLVARAFSNSQIAAQLYVSEATVKRHLTRVYAKLRARSRLDAVHRAVALGLLSSPGGRRQ